ncbi:Cof-type HAD-IIB family hydrolase [bacterium]|nr:Cof-type HAD-IIB family hydrolase [bacterium]
MKDKKLYITDLDGTLLREDGSLSPFCKRTLQEMMAADLPFTVASARSVFSMQDLLRGLTFTLPIIAINGGSISDLATGAHYVINEIRTEVSTDLLSMIADSGFAPYVSTFNGKKDCLYYNRIVNKGMQWYLDDRKNARDSRLHYLETLSASLADQVICIIVMGKAAPLSDLRETIHEKHGSRLMTQFYENQYSRGWFWLSIHDARATKGQALRTLVDRWGLKDRELVVFGDAENDIEMFQEADRAIAVANAESALKIHATEIIGPNRDDSVVRFIAAETGLAARPIPN